MTPLYLLNVANYTIHFILNKFAISVSHCQKFILNEANHITNIRSNF